MLSFLYGFLVLCGLAVVGWLAHRFVVRPDEPVPAGGAVFGAERRLEEVTPRPSLIAPRTALPAPQLAPPVVHSTPEPLSMQATWARMMNAVHLLIVGETGSGKSTAANALLSGRAGSDMVCVIDPHDTPDAWGGIPAIGAGRDYPAIDQALQSLLKEMGDRYDRRAVGDTVYAPLTIFLDELPSIMKHCPAAKQFLGEMLREARKVDMRLVCLTQSTRVKTLGIEGEGDVLENLTWLLLGEHAISATRDAAVLDYPAALEHKGRVQAVMTTALPGLASARILPARIWHLSIVSDDALWLSGELAPEDSATDTEVRRLAASIDRTGSDQAAGVISEREPVATQTGLAVPIASTIAGSDAVKPVRDDLPQDAQSRAIRALVREGISRNQTIDLLHLSGGKAVALKQIKRALGEEID